MRLKGGGQGGAVTLAPRPQGALQQRLPVFQDALRVAAGQGGLGGISTSSVPSKHDRLDGEGPHPTMPPHGGSALSSSPSAALRTQTAGPCMVTASHTPARTVLSAAGLGRKPPCHATPLPCSAPVVLQHQARHHERLPAIDEPRPRGTQPPPHSLPLIVAEAVAKQGGPVVNTGLQRGCADLQACRRCDSKAHQLHARGSMFAARLACAQP